MNHNDLMREYLALPAEERQSFLVELAGAEKDCTSDEGSSKVRAYLKTDRTLVATLAFSEVEVNLPVGFCFNWSFLKEGEDYRIKIHHTQGRSRIQSALNKEEERYSNRVHGALGELRGVAKRLGVSFNVALKVLQEVLKEEEDNRD